LVFESLEDEVEPELELEVVVAAAQGAVVPRRGRPLKWLVEQRKQLEAANA